MVATYCINLETLEEKRLLCDYLLDYKQVLIHLWISSMSDISEEKLTFLLSIPTQMSEFFLNHIRQWSLDSLVYNYYSCGSIQVEG